MSAGARRGASPAVVRALEHSGAHVARSSESASCPLCNGVLRFFSGDFGQTLEQCDSARCLNHVPHHPQPDPNASEPAQRGGKKRNRKTSDRERGTVPPELRGGMV